MKMVGLWAAGAFLAALPALAREKWPAPSEEAVAHEKEVKAHEKEVVDRVIPQLAAWAAKGKPYIPHASQPSDLPQAPVPAFTGAEGGGAHSFGGRGGKVYVVTSLDDSGPGTLREACEAVGPRIVVFNVAGIIRLKVPIFIEAPYITIAGQTAPGDGICIAGQGIMDNAHDVIIRYVRFRKGITDLWDRTSGLAGNPIGNIILDHVSASWGNDQTLDTYRHMYYPAGGGRAEKIPTVNDTIQWSVVAEGLNTYSHGFGGDWGGRNTTFHHNLFACNTARNPSVAMSYDFNFVNNVLFNWKHRSVDGGDKDSLFNMINNYYKPGPATLDNPVRYRILEPAQSWTRTDPVSRWGKVYAVGNVVEGFPAVTADNWAGGIQFNLAPDQDASGAVAKGLIVDPVKIKAIAANIRSDQPFPMAPLEIQSAQDAYTAVLAGAGDTLPRRDSVDQRVVEETRTGVVWGQGKKIPIKGMKGLPKNDWGVAGDGIITEISQVGGYPVYQGSPAADLGPDGIPAWWKTKYGLDAQEADLANKDLQGDGYTVMDKYLDGLDPTKKLDWSDPNTNRNNLTEANFYPANAPVKAAAVVMAEPTGAAAAAATEATFVKKLEARSAHIVAMLHLSDPAAAAAVQRILVAQYQAINQWHAANDDKPANQTAASQKGLHNSFLAKLAAVPLTPEQVDTVKDGMTVNKVQVTYDAYLKFLPNLPAADQAKILELLKAAREEAIDCASMDEKSNVFKKYKGRINIFLGKEGFDVGKAEKAFMQKQKADAPRRPAAARALAGKPSGLSRSTFDGDTVSTTVEQWGIFDLPLKGPTTGNPFTDVTLTARFTQGDKAVQVTGFYDGDGTYRVRFMPETTGVWQYVTQSSASELNGQMGSVTVGPPSAGNHGPVKVSGLFHFAYADGTPYFQLGTTCYAWAHRSDAQEEETLQTLAASPFNKIRMCIFPQDNKVFAPRFFPYVGTPPKNWDTTRFDPAFFQHLERRVGQLRDLGIVADLILFHPYGGTWGFSNRDAASDDRYVRYVVARLSAYRNVWWSMANEYDFIKTKHESDWDRMTQIVWKSDPYGHLRSIHNGTLIYDQSHPWITHASIQNGAAVEDPERAMLYRDVYRKPIVFDEVKYEGDIYRRWGQLSAEDLIWRFWNGLIAGTYVGHSEIFQSTPDPWLAGGGKLIGKSEPRLAFFRKVMEEGPPSGIDPIDKWEDKRTGGVSGEYYIVYFGKEALASWPFSLYKTGLKDGMTFKAELIDTWNMTVTPVPGTFVAKKPNPNAYYFVDTGGKAIELPGRPYLALRIRREPATSPSS